MESLSQDLNGLPVSVYLPRDRMMDLKKHLAVRENIMTMIYTDQHEL